MMTIRRNSRFGQQQQLVDTECYYAFNETLFGEKSWFKIKAPVIWTSRFRCSELRIHFKSHQWKISLFISFVLLTNKRINETTNYSSFSMGKFISTKWSEIWITKLSYYLLIADLDKRDLCCNGDNDTFANANFYHALRPAEISPSKLTFNFL